MKPELFSIVIATYRRTGMLRDSVLSLKAMQVPPGVDLEVIIIDNDPDGGARPTVAKLAEICCESFDLRYVHEARTGLSYARNRGAEESRGEIFGFLDDDIFVDERWLCSMIECFERTGADCVGGRTLIHWEDPPSPALLACETQLVAIDLGETDFEVRGQQLPGGGNAAFRRSVFDRGFRFATELGRVGNVLLSGEDTDLFLRLRRSGSRIWYCAQASMRHRTGGERLTPEYMIRRKYWFGISFAVIDRKLHGPVRLSCRALARLAKLVFVEVPKIGWSRLRNDRPAELLARCSAAKQLGYLRGTVAPPPVAAASHPASASRPLVATPQP